MTRFALTEATHTCPGCADWIRGPALTDETFGPYRGYRVPREVKRGMPISKARLRPLKRVARNTMFCQSCGFTVVVQ